MRYLLSISIIRPRAPSPRTRARPSALGALAALLAAAVTAFAAESIPLEPAAFSTPPIGTRITWADTDSGNNPRTIEITGTDGMLRHYRRQDGENVSHYIFCFYCAGAQFDIAEYAAFWPLEIGKEVDLGPAMGPRVWWNVITVTGTERVTVPAGTFDTYVVLVRSWDQVKKSMLETRIHYAPELGWGVRYESLDVHGNKQRRSVVDIEYPSSAGRTQTSS
ncbi:MAG: hypothetical protein R3286_02845 [Gammaproteobacteria bacterium]|nr:hypothetical protein [Gammaproteobacteria bacterium]